MSLLAGIVVLSISIVVHELGHLLLGKMVGIKATVFSFGYGKGIIKKKFGDTVYQITAIPLGGYVKFAGDDALDRSNAKPGDFFYAKPLTRIVPVLGGPLFNLILGVIIFAGFNFTGQEKPSAKVMVSEKIEFVDPHSGVEKSYQSPAYAAGMRSGDVVTKINKEPIQFFTDLQFAVMFSDQDQIETEFIRDQKKRVVLLNGIRLQKGGHIKIGVQPYMYFGLNDVIADGPMARADLQPGDTILSLDGIQPDSMQHLTKVIRHDSDGKLAVKVLRQQSVNTDSEKETEAIDSQGGKKQVEIVKDVVLEKRRLLRFANVSPLAYPDLSLASKEILEFSSINSFLSQGLVVLNGQVIKNSQQFLDQAAALASMEGPVKLVHGAGEYLVKPEVEPIYYAGVAFGYSKPDTIKVEYGLMASVGVAFIDAFEFVRMNLIGIGKLFSGDLSVQENLSGPIRIAKIAGDMASYGIGPLFLFLAHISVVLMIMNLLPIPVVDGGHIVFFLIEAAMGRPLSVSVQEKITSIGVMFLITLGIYVIFNDILSLDIIKNFFKMLG